MSGDHHDADAEIVAVVTAATAFIGHPLARPVIEAGCEDFSEQPDAAEVETLAGELADAVRRLGEALAGDAGADDGGADDAEAAAH